ncbi:MAG: thiamine-phosphate kinase, partial [Gemmatimonadetes bacterium]|nr:thiamine-phosphate kinase [Gemmatimonadota bacterium]
MIEAVGAPEVPEVALGPGDDAAVLRVSGPESLVVSSDLSVEGIHFRREWLTWDAIGFRAVAAALSDLAAMAARPIGVLVSLATPPELDARTLAELAGGIGICLREHEAALLGGDLSRSPGPVVLDVTVIGAAARPVARSGAVPGDEVWVTGRLGGAAAAAAAWSGGLEPHPAARRAFERPSPRLLEAHVLRESAEVHAMIDLSDGLAADAEQIAAASGVGLVIESGAVPVHEVLENWARPDAALAIAVGGGEDYELLAALAPGTALEAASRLYREFELDLTRVGTVVEGAGVAWFSGTGELTDPPASGFD